MADPTAYGPTPAVGTADFQAIINRDYHTIDYLNSTGSDINPGSIVVVGTMPLYSPGLIANGKYGTLMYLTTLNVKKDSSAFSQGDAVYWNSSGSPLVGAGSSGCCTSTPSAYLIGWAMADAGATITRVAVSMSAAKRTSTIGGSVTADDISASDAALAIAGLNGVTTANGGTVSLTGGASIAGATGAGGAATVAGGASGSTNGAGGAVAVTGGVGTGTGAGGAIGVTGGAGAASGTGNGGAILAVAGASGTGATGAGGAATLRGGAALSTNGAGGAIAVTGGLGNGTGAGGAVTITAGASGGATGTAGAVSIDTGAAAGGTGAGITIGGTNATAITLGKMPVFPVSAPAAAGSVVGDATQLVAGLAFVTGADGTKGVKLPAVPTAGTMVIVKSVTAGSVLKVWPDASATINAIGANAAISMASLTSAIFVASSTTQWYTVPLLPS